MTRFPLLFLVLSSSQALTDDENLFTFRLEPEPFGQESIDLSSLPQDYEHINEHVEQIAERWHRSHPKDGDPTYTFMNNKYGDRFACRLPSGPAPRRVTHDSPHPRAVALQLRRGLSADKCLHKAMPGWWRYELCFGRRARQYHLPDKDNKNDKSEVQKIVLGALVSDLRIGEQLTPTTPLYAEETYEGGEACAIEGQARRAIVRYHCDRRLPEHSSYIADVSETRSCEYLFTVNTGALCKLPQFKPVLPSEIARPITCSRVLSLEEKIRHLEGKTLSHIYESALPAIRTRVTSAVHRLLYAKRTEMRNETWVMCPLVRRRSLLQLDRIAFPSDRVTQAMRRFTQTSAKYIVEKTKALLALRGVSISADHWDFYESDYDRVVKKGYEDGTISFKEVANDHRDASRWHIWSFFRDPHWDRSEFPRRLDDVDLVNGYVELAASKAILVKDDPKMADIWLRREMLARPAPYEDQEIDDESLPFLFPKYPRWLSADWLASLSPYSEELEEGEEPPRFSLRLLLLSKQRQHKAASDQIARQFGQFLLDSIHLGRPLPSMDTVAKQLSYPIAASQADLDELWELFQGVLEMDEDEQLEDAGKTIALQYALNSLMRRLLFARRWVEENKDVDVLDENDFEQDFADTADRWDSVENRREAHRLVQIIFSEEKKVARELAEETWDLEKTRLISTWRNAKLLEQLIDTDRIFVHQLFEILDGLAETIAAKHSSATIESPLVKPVADRTILRVSEDTATTDEVIGLYNELFKRASSDQEAYDGSHANE